MLLKTHLFGSVAWWSERAGWWSTRGRAVSCLEIPHIGRTVTTAILGNVQRRGLELMMLLYYDIAFFPTSSSIE